MWPGHVDIIRITHHLHWWHTTPIRAGINSIRPVAKTVNAFPTNIYNRGVSYCKTSRVCVCVCVKLKLSANHYYGYCNLALILPPMHVFTSTTQCVRLLMKNTVPSFVPLVVINSAKFRKFRSKITRYRALHQISLIVNNAYPKCIWSWIC